MLKRRMINDKQVLILVRLIEASKKFLVFLVLLGQLVNLLPQRVLQAKSINSEQQENIIEYDSNDFDDNLYADVRKSDIPIDLEIESMRSLNEKVFRKMDGSYEVSIYPDVVHYLDNGKYLEIDNSLVDSAENLKNKSNTFEIEFPKLFSSNDKVKFSLDDYKINWRLINSQKSTFKTKPEIENRKDKTELSKTTSSIIYENVLPYTDIEYILSGSRIKENIYLKSYSENLSFVFEYDVKNLSLIQKANGIVFENNQGEVVFSFSGLFMIDSESNISEDIQILSRQITKDIYEVTVLPSDEWLKTAVFPVVIDPTLYNPLINMSLVDTYVSQSSPTSNYHASSIMKIGGASGNEAQSLVKFSLPSMVSNQVITYAHVELIRPTTSVNTFQINVFKNTSDFSVEDVTWANGKPLFNCNEVVDYYEYSTGLTRVIFDVTQTAKEWQNDPSSNFGLTLAADDLTGEYKSFYQYDNSPAYRPIVRIGFENPSGLKDYWTYTSQDIGQVGTGYISDYTGNLTFVRNEYQVNNEYLPLSLIFYFNNATRTHNIGYGNGWKTNFNMKIEYDEYAYRYFMSKPDGSRVYFSETDSTYDDGYDYINYIAEDGSKMKLEMVYYNWELSSTTLKTTDLMTYIFDSQGRLTQIINDRNYHKLFVYYIGITDRLNYVSDMVGNRIDFTYTLYGNNYIMTKTELKLKQPDTATFNIVQDKTYSYYTASTSPRLYKIIQRFNKSGSSTPLFSTGDTLRYYFSSINSRLLYAYNDTSKHKVSYAYDSNSRVSTVDITDLKIDSVNETLNLGSITITYDNEKTRYVNHKSEWIEYLFDSYGHTINAYDSFGNATYWKYAGLFTYNLDPSNTLSDAQIISYDPNYYIVHALLESSKTMKQQVNYINNPGFEDLGSNLRWIKTGNGYIQKDIETSAFGDASLRIYNDGTTFAYQDVFLKAGVYTLQGIVKNTNDLVTGSSIINVETASNTFYDSTSVIGEWSHLNVQFEITSDQTVRIKLINARYNTNSYFDNISLTEGFMDARYNNVINPSFEEGTDNWVLNGAEWVSDNFYTDANQDLLGEKSLKIDGDGGSSKYFYQDISNFINNGVSYFIGGWGKANAVPHKGYLNTNSNQVSDGRFFGLYIEYIYYNSAPPYTQAPEVDYIFLPFNTSTDDWQYQMRTFEIDVYQLLSVRIYGKYQGEGTAFFDNVQIYRDKLNTEYDYDITNGYLEQIIQSNGVATSFERDSNGNIIVIHEGGKTIEIDYFQNRITEIQANNVKTSFIYDSTSKLITETLMGDTGSTGEWFKSSTTYTSDKQYITSQTDEFGHTTTLETNHLNGLIETITNANNHLKSYDYNNYGALTQEVETDISNQYTIVKDFTYDSNHRLSGISIDGITYSFEYDDLDRIIEVKIVDINYVTLNYVNEDPGTTIYSTGKIDSQTYGTGDKYTFIYTAEDQIKLIRFKDVDLYAYVYDQSGRLAIYKELQNNNIFFYSYDLNGRVKQITDKNGNKINYYYDENGHINQYTYEVDQYNREVYYYYDETTGEYLFTLYETGNETVSKINHIDTTDSLRRLEYVELLIGTLSFTEHFTYKTPVAGRGNASLVVASITYKKDGNVQYTHLFTYDALGNIIEITVENENSYETENYRYIYDGFNRLTRENIVTINYQQTIIYTYDDYSDSNTDDNRGNLTSIKHYAYTIYTPSGTPLSETRLFYKTTGWKDQITHVQYFVSGSLQRTAYYTYDQIGNITGITSNINQSFDWEGRRLIEHSIGGTTYTYTYNDQGIRTSRSDGTQTTTYFLDGSLVLFEKTGNDVIYYTYDADGSILSLNYLGDEYFYIKNLQGDIIEIVDASGTSVAKYRYDAWGNIIYQWDSGLGIANANPYRYRSYRLDSGTGLYYLNARYYDPSIGRFISADSINYLDPSSGQGLNLYAYCGNNPVMYTDITGYLPEWLENTLAIGGVVLLVAGIAVAAVFTGGLAGAALMAVAFSTGIGASSGFSKAIEEDTSIAAGVLSGGIKGLATGTAIGLGIMTGGGAFSALGGLTAFGGSLAINFGAGIGSNAIDSKMNNRDFSLNNAINNGFKQMVSGAFAFAAGGLIGASGFYNIPGQTKMFSSQWFGNTASGLLFKAVYYYGIDAVIWMI